MNVDVADFIIYIINAIANCNGLYPSKVYKAMNETDCIDNFLVPFYDILHTMGTQSIIDNTLEYMRKRGVAI